MLVLVGGGALLWSDRIVHEIPAGHGGVLWLRLFGGTVEQPALGEGVHLTFPWDSLILYDIRFRAVHRQLTAVTRDGLEVGLTVSYRYRPSAEVLGTLHRRVGPQYERVLVRASMDAALREIVARYTSADLHSADRGEINARVVAALSDDLRRGSLSAGRAQGQPMVQLDDFLIRSVTLPPSVAASVQHKNRQRHLVEEYDFRLRRELAESHRRVTEAQGIAAFQAQLAKRGDLEGFLRLRGVAATEALATAPASKVVVTGPGGRQPPVIVTFPPAGPSAAPPVPEAGSISRKPPPPPPEAGLSVEENQHAEAALATAAEPPDNPMLARVRGLWQRLVTTVGRWTGLDGSAP
ncbi:prohibitin family protein [Caenispirillum salinarum]|uniref:prohibitin family protein n=1 Tax=Caenispirillum salinarum TaxID=859058 RepID=UPI00384EEFA1